MLQSGAADWDRVISHGSVTASDMSVLTDALTATGSSGHARAAGAFGAPETPGIVGKFGAPSDSGTVADGPGFAHVKAHTFTSGPLRKL
jgi:hypothetical protein